MYRNHIRNRAENRLWQFSIDLSEIGPDPRVKFVEHVCRTLSESRFGPGRTSNLIVDLTDRPELQPAVFYDLDEGGQLTPCYISALGRADYQAVYAEFRRANQMGLVDTPPADCNSSPLLTSNQGRGSP